MSVRPGSAMGSRGPPPPPVTVKKTRAPAKPRTDSSKSGPGRPRKKSPPVTETDSNTNDIGAIPAADSSNQSSDVDSLTSGMKKIKISLITKAQKEARDQEKLRANIEQSQVDGTASSPMSNDKSPTSAESEMTYNQSEVSRPMKSISPGPSTPQLFLPPHLPTHMQEPERVPLPTSSPIASPIAPRMEQNEFGNLSDHSSEYNADKFVPFEPQGPVPSTMVQQEPLGWLPPNTNTPAAMKKYDLPVFTSTSAIPFAPSSDVVGDQNKPSKSHVKQDSSDPEPTQLAPSIWDIPITPRNQ